MKTLTLTMIASLALATTTLAVAAQADEVALKAPLQAGSLHTGPMDMVAYRIDLEDGAYEVTATFRARTATAEPSRVKMRLEDQDKVSFAMPAEPSTLYTFARVANNVTISAVQTPIKLAAR